jgi:hypothetical protein
MGRDFFGTLWSAGTLPTGFAGLENAAADVIKVVLYDNTITPDNDATVTNFAYGAGVWSTTGGGTGTPQVFQAGQWAQGGQTLANKQLRPPDATALADTIYFDGDDTASGAAATLSNIVGAFVYDDSTTATPVDLGICYNWFSGAQQVTNGTLTVVWHANGIWRISL